MKAEYISRLENNFSNWRKSSNQSEWVEDTKSRNVKIGNKNILYLDRLDNS